MLPPLEPGKSKIVPDLLQRLLVLGHRAEGRRGMINSNWINIKSCVTLVLEGCAEEDLCGG